MKKSQMDRRGREPEQYHTIRRSPKKHRTLPPKDGLLPESKRDGDMGHDKHINSSEDSDHLKPWMSSQRFKELTDDDQNVLAQELEELHSRARRERFDQITDDILMEKAMNMRYSIRDFCIQHFEGHTDELTVAEDAPYLNYMKQTTPNRDSYKEYLKSSLLRPSIIQTFLWIVLECEVFGGLDWAPSLASSRFRRLKDWISPYSQNSPGNESVQPEAEQKFQMWNVMTTRLILDSMNRRIARDCAPTKESNLKKRKDVIIDSIEATIGRGVSSEEEDFTDGLSDIIDVGLEFDEIVNQQGAHVHFRFWDLDPEKGFYFDPTCMESDRGGLDTLEAEVLKPKLMVAPALMKKGKASGEDFHLEERVLMKMVVNSD